MEALIKVEKTLRQLINEQGMEYITPAVSQIVHEAFLDAGIKSTSDDDKMLLIARFAKELNEYYGYLTGPEIRFAVHNGVVGRYGDYAGLNLKTLCKFLEEYLKSSERRKYVVQLQQSRAITQTDRLLSQEGVRSEHGELEAFKAMINFSYGRWQWYKGKPEMCGTTYVSKQAKVFDPTGRIREQLLKDGLMSKDESLLQAYSRMYKDGHKTIYQL